MYFAGDEENFNKDHADGVRRKPGTQDDYTAGIKKPQQDCPCHSGGVLLKWNRIDPDFSGNIETAGICAEGRSLKNKIFQARDLYLRALDTNSACAKSVLRNERKT